MTLLMFFFVLAQADFSNQLVQIKRVYIDRLTGGETAAQMRDLLMSSLENTKLFIVTENQDRADVVMRGAAEDLIFTDSFSSNDGINMHAGSNVSSGQGSSTHFNGAGSGYDSRSGRAFNMGIGENDSLSTKERKHEALATVRLVNKDGDVIWSTTQESVGAKFHGASADVADKVARQLAADLERVRSGK